MTLKSTINTPSVALDVAQSLLLESQDLTAAQVESVLGNIMQSQVDDADIYFQTTRSEGWSLEEGIVKAGSFSIDQGVGV
ncbi:MAG: PmbA/TldA family metallopeptidase, partial [Fluviibacter sp.]